VDVVVGVSQEEDGVDPFSEQLGETLVVGSEDRTQRLDGSIADKSFNHHGGERFVSKSSATSLLGVHIKDSDDPITGVAEHQVHLQRIVTYASSTARGDAGGVELLDTSQLFPAAPPARRA
jgi:hypothetical protein